jgi:hypothetical protein
MVAVTLSRPIKAHGEDITVLTLREPTGDDVERLGLPFSFSADGKTLRFDMSAVRGYAAALAGIPPSALKDVAPSDWMGIAGVVAGFFGAGSTPVPATR